MMKHLIFEISDRICQIIPSWSILDEEIKQKYRETYFMLYFNRYLKKSPCTVATQP
jgi:hypothetical protein